MTWPEALVWSVAFVVAGYLVAAFIKESFR